MFPKRKDVHVIPLKEKLHELPKPRINIWASSKKIVGGAIVLGIDYLYEMFSEKDPTATHESYRSFLIKSSGYGLVIDGAFEISTAGLMLLSDLYENLATGKSKSKRRNKRDDSIKEERLEQASSNTLALITDSNRPVSDKVIIKYDNTIRIIHLARSSLGTIINLFVCCRALYNIYQNPVNFFSLSFPEGIEPRNTFIPKFLVIPALSLVSATLNGIGFLYNLRELRLSYLDPYARRGDVPLFGFMNASAYLGFSSEIAHRFAPSKSKGFDLHFPAGSLSIEDELLILQSSIEKFKESTTPGYTYLSAVILNKIALYFIYKNFSQIVMNSFDYFKKSSVTIEEITDINVTQTLTNQMSSALATSSEHVANTTLASTNGIRSRRLNFNETPQPLLSYYHNTVNAKSEKYEPPKIKVKEKTRGVADPNYSAAAAATVAAIGAFTPNFGAMQPTRDTKHAEELFFISDKTRNTALLSINECRTRRVIPKRKIDSELDKLRKLLPNSRINNIDGSEHELTWHWKDKGYSIKFETPHGLDASQFRGNKLRKILNVLEAGYLWGWEQEKTKVYMNTRTPTGRFEPLYYIFGERPAF